MSEIVPDSNKYRLALVSNRLPVYVKKNEQNQYELVSGTGGLVTALAPILRNRRGVWIGWPGIDDVEKEKILSLLRTAEKSSGFSLEPTFLTKEEIHLFYDGFSNEIIWPLFHDLQALCNFNPDYWAGYLSANEKFADKILKCTTVSDFLWVHDYHLMPLANCLRQKNYQARLGFFLHIPFPSLDIFVKLPWRFEIIRALLEYDLIGFQTTRDKRNFMQCVRMLLPDVHIEHRRDLHLCHIGPREVRVGSFPISIDYQQLSKLASSKKMDKSAWDTHERFPYQKMIFSVDRLDYTKGIVQRLKAIHLFLKKHPELHKKATFIQVIVPSRIEIPVYQSLKEEIDQLVGKINSEFSKEGWVPIHYLFRSIDQEELLSYYRTSEICLVTSIKDGMNLVAKEYIASNVDENGVLILSEFTGATAQLQDGALLINPYDTQRLADTIYYALTMADSEKKKRMRKLRRHTKRYDIFWWVKSFLNAAFQKELIDFPLSPEYIPSEENTPY